MCSGNVKWIDSQYWDRKAGIKIHKVVFVGGKNLKQAKKEMKGGIGPGAGFDSAVMDWLVKKKEQGIVFI